MAKKRKQRKIQKTNAPRKCFFCADKKEPNFSNVATLNRFLTERAKIIPRMRSGLCAKHQKSLTLSIKYARHLALLPFVVSI